MAFAHSIHHAVVLRLASTHRDHGPRGGPALDELRSASGKVRVHICLHVERRFLVLVLWMRLHTASRAFEHLPVGLARCRHPLAHLLARELDVNVVRCDEVGYISSLQTEIAVRSAEAVRSRRRRPSSTFPTRRCPCTPPLTSPGRSVQRVSDRRPLRGPSAR